MAKKKKDPTQMDKVTAGYEKFIKGKKLNNDGKNLFNKALKKAIPKKQSSPK